MKVAIISFLTYFSSIEDSISTIKALTQTDKYHRDLLSRTTDLFIKKFNETFTNEEINKYIINMMPHDEKQFHIKIYLQKPCREFNLSFAFQTQASAKWLKAKTENNLDLKCVIEKAVFCIIPSLENPQQAEHIIKFFINAGASLDTGYKEKNHGLTDALLSENDTILHRLMQPDQLNARIVASLIEYNANPNALNSRHQTPLEKFITTASFCSLIIIK